MPPGRLYAHGRTQTSVSPREETDTHLALIWDGPTADQEQDLFPYSWNLEMILGS